MIDNPLILEPGQGGFEAFPAAAGIYCIEPHRDLDPQGHCYVGASKNLRQRLRTQLVGGYQPAWARRLGELILLEMDTTASRLDPDFHQRAFALGEFGRINCRARVLELIPSGEASSIKRAEDRWMVELSPTLTDHRRTRGGYKLRS